MKITIKKDQIVKGLQTVQGVVNHTAHLPVITNVMMNAESGRLTLTATDLDVTINCSVEADVKAKGSTTVSARKMFGIVREMTGTEIEIESDEKNVVSVRCGKSFYHINGLGSEDFPPTSKITNSKKIEIDQSELKQLMLRSSFAMSSEASRYILCSLLLVIGEESVASVSADGRRLVLASCEAKSKKANCGQILIPTKAVNELAGIVQESGTATVEYSDTSAVFTMNNEGFPISLHTKLVEGSYPNYKQIIPNDSNEKVKVPRVELISALKRAEFMTSEKMSSVKLTFSKNNLTVSANSPDIGDASESIDIKYKGAEIAIAFNPKYLLDALGVLEDEDVSFEMVDEISPLVVKIEGPFVYVLSPMRQA